MSTLRILTADDHALIRRGLRELLESQPDWTICAEEANGQRAVERAGELKPDIAILDIRMPELNGIDAARKVAITLGLSTKTVETHRASLMRKLEAHDVATLVR